MAASAATTTSLVIMVHKLYVDRVLDHVHRLCWQQQQQQQQPDDGSKSKVLDDPDDDDGWITITPPPPPTFATTNSLQVNEVCCCSALKVETTTATTGISIDDRCNNSIVIPPWQKQKQNKQSSSLSSYKSNEFMTITVLGDQSVSAGVSRSRRGYVLLWLKDKITNNSSSRSDHYHYHKKDASNHNMTIPGEGAWIIPQLIQSISPMARQNISWIAPIQYQHTLVVMMSSPLSLSTSTSTSTSTCCTAPGASRNNNNNNQNNNNVNNHPAMKRCKGQDDDDRTGQHHNRNDHDRDDNDHNDTVGRNQPSGGIASTDALQSHDLDPIAKQIYQALVAMEENIAVVIPFKGSVTEAATTADTTTTTTTKGIWDHNNINNKKSNNDDNDDDDSFLLRVDCYPREYTEIVCGSLQRAVAQVVLGNSNTTDNNNNNDNSRNSHSSTIDPISNDTDIDPFEGPLRMTKSRSNCTHRLNVIMVPQDSMVPFVSHYYDHGVNKNEIVNHNTEQDLPTRRRSRKRCSKHNSTVVKTKIVQHGLGDDHDNVVGQVTTDRITQKTISTQWICLWGIEARPKKRDRVKGGATTNTTAVNDDTNNYGSMVQDQHHGEEYIDIVTREGGKSSSSSRDSTILWMDVALNNEAAQEIVIMSEPQKKEQQPQYNNKAEKWMMHTSKPNNTGTTTNPGSVPCSSCVPVSRAYYKLQQVWVDHLRTESWLNTRSPAAIAIDLGAAPGGWTQVLVHDMQFQQVVTVDRGLLSPRVAGLSQVHHVVTSIQQWEPSLSLPMLSPSDHNNNKNDPIISSTSISSSSSSSSSNCSNNNNKSIALVVCDASLVWQELFEMLFKSKVLEKLTLSLPAAMVLTMKLPFRTVNSIARHIRGLYQALPGNIQWMINALYDKRQQHAADVMVTETKPFIRCKYRLVHLMANSDSERTLLIIFEKSSPS